jgi:putative cardiolipin synthase
MCPNRNKFPLNVSCLLFISLLFLMGGCASLPPNSANPETYALQDTTDTRLGKKYLELEKGHAEKSGFLLLGKGLDAFTARMVLAQDADRSIDAQYYMIHKDLTGTLFADQLLKAADRGVRVRLLLDDIDLSDRDKNHAVFASHPNIDVRVFNPFSRNTMRAPQFLTRFGTVTRRMHNKSFTVDNLVTVVGGRNIGDEYFDADPDLAFADLDLLAIGPVIQEVSTSFDAYWNSELSYPIEILHPELIGSDQLEKGRKQLATYLADDAAVNYQQLLLNSKLAKSIREHSVQYSWGEAKALYDHPQKVENYDHDQVYNLSYQMNIFLEGLHKELIIFSPYFVPGKQGTKRLSALSKRGVRVRILTNSLASTDVSVVHTGYAKYRTTLLRNGVELYEMNRTMSRKDRKQKKGIHGSSKASLHAKSLILDREQVFIGSLNLDPRWITENTEIGIMLQSREIAALMAGAFDQMAEQKAFRLELRTDEEGIEYIYWHGLENEEERVWTVEPYTSFWHRFGIFFMSLLPIESQL